MRFAKKLLAVVMAIACMTATALPAFAATPSTPPDNDVVLGETTLDETEPAATDGVAPGEKVIYFNVNPEADVAQAAPAYVTYEVYPQDNGLLDYYLGIPNYVNLNGNYNGRFEYYNIADGWKEAGQGYLAYSHFSGGYFYWGLNSTWVASFPMSWKTFQYRYIY
jgi:hypothetical protein